MTLPIEIPDYLRVLYLFGLSGAGKNYVADLLGRVLGIAVYHADADLTMEMRQAVSEKRQFTEEMRDRYFGVIADKIDQQLQSVPRLVVTQATYKTQHRKLLEERFPGIFFIWVDAPEELITKRLIARGDDITPEYAKKMRANFETPDDSIPRLVNSGPEEGILEQLALIFKKFA